MFDGLLSERYDKMPQIWQLECSGKCGAADAAADDDADDAAAPIHLFNPCKICDPCAKKLTLMEGMQAEAEAGVDTALELVVAAMNSMIKLIKSSKAVDKECISAVVDAILTALRLAPKSNGIKLAGERLRKLIFDLLTTDDLMTKEGLPRTPSQCMSMIMEPLFSDASGHITRIIREVHGPVLQSLYGTIILPALMEIMTYIPDKMEYYMFRLDGSLIMSSRIAKAVKIALAEMAVPEERMQLLTALLLSQHLCRFDRTFERRRKEQFKKFFATIKEVDESVLDSKPVCVQSMYDDVCGMAKDLKNPDDVAVHFDSLDLLKFLAALYAPEIKSDLDGIEFTSDLDETEIAAKLSQATI